VGRAAVGERRVLKELDISSFGRKLERVVQSSDGKSKLHGKVEIGGVVTGAETASCKLEEPAEICWN